MMGTLFFVLHLAILGRVPQIFYTCEISWLAAYLFFLSSSPILSLLGSCRTAPPLVPRCSYLSSYLGRCLSLWPERSEGLHSRPGVTNPSYLLQKFHSLENYS